jgi:hypothetical protein
MTLSTSRSFGGAPQAATAASARRPAPQPIDELDESVDSEGWGVEEAVGRGTNRSQQHSTDEGWPQPDAQPVHTYIDEQYGDDDPLLSSFQMVSENAEGSPPPDAHPAHTYIDEQYGDDDPLRSSLQMVSDDADVNVPEILASHSEEDMHTYEPAILPHSGSRAEVQGGTGFTPANRVSASPSWGRVTQPVESSFDSETDYPHSGTVGRSAALTMGRMSDSTLRKISTRAAALQQNTRPTLERPALADDTRGDLDAASYGSAPVRPGSVTRPMSTQRRLANTQAAAPQGRSRSAGRGAGRGAGHSPTAAEFTKDLHVLDEKARELETEIQTYR